jgi:hypothetical protein
MMDSTAIGMSVEGFEEFMEGIATPSTPVPEIVDLFQRHALWEDRRPSSFSLWRYRAAHIRRFELRKKGDWSARG